MSIQSAPSGPAAPHNLLADWPAILRAGVCAVGGKAATLARLAELQFPVPQGLVVPSGWYHDWIAESLAACLEASKRSAIDGGEAIRSLHAQLRGRQAPDALKTAIGRAMHLAPWLGSACVVRSSAPDEDSAHASFAGIHHTTLNVSGIQAISQAVVDVWASLWTSTAVAYRHLIGLTNEHADMAVLIMPLVRAEAAGVGFNCDPTTGRLDQIVISANFGLGESIVGGLADCDEAVLQISSVDETLTLARYRTGTKQQSSRPLPSGGTALQAAATHLSDGRVLNEAQAVQLGQLLRLAATALGDVETTFDMEWAFDGQRFWLLQARPVTAAARCTYPALEALPDIWSRGNTVDVLPDPLSPIEWATVLSTCNSMLDGACRLAGFPLHPGIQRVRIVDGRMYLNMSVIQWECFDGFGLTPSATNRLVGGHQPEIPVAKPDAANRWKHLQRKLRYGWRATALRRKGRRQVATLQTMCREWRHRAMPACDHERLRLIRTWLSEVRASDGLLFMQGSGGGAVTMLVDMLAAKHPGEGESMAAALMAGGRPSVSAQQGYDLVAVSRIARNDPVARAWLGEPGPQRGTWRALPADNPFRRAFSDFIDRYGHRGIYETYLRNPRWYEEADDLLDSLPALAELNLAEIARRQQAATTETWRRLKASWPWWRRAILNLVLSAARRDSNDREAARSGFIAGAEPLRRLLLAIGSDWRERGWLEYDAQVLLLMIHEIEAVLDGTRPGTALKALVKRRQTQFQIYERRVPEDVIIEGGEASATPANALRAEAGRHEGNKPHDNVLCGVAVGSGKGAGPVRRVLTPSDGTTLRDGDVLLAPSLDPAWTPLMLRASALIVETGGFMSHGATVAREFGIPAVVNLPGVLAKLRDGEMVQVDGTKGTVTRLDQDS